MTYTLEIAKNLDFFPLKRGMRLTGTSPFALSVQPAGPTEISGL